ncbi:LacI family DNA-binding transcriptional regulator [Capillimicrobium parvum]|uniref:HTH-type transcriptional repressor ExuR n=1 Tax=Capillimicrobium parvum TaxID=2884022 RepID=A0A9E6Y2B8_9ACTN|nr:LacI family DNA-binding transcriptional regulator [Capillimicrobium parvum]UGS38568.1 putative HTH-type transcriptional repressor ExuR [Capillimicrobium parvum]
MRAPTSHDVAALAGVSQPTVSRALRGDPRVAPDTIRRVREAAGALAYVPSRRGRSLSTRATGQVAVVVRDLGNPFYSEAILHLHAALDAAGRRAVVHTDLPGRPFAAEQLLDGAVDAAILTTTLVGSALPGALADRGLPVVQFNRTAGGDAADACESDNAGGGREVATLLAGLGHTEIGAILGPADTSTGRDREAGLRAGLAQRGIALADARVRRGPFSTATGHEGLASLMAAPHPPSAVFCGNDVVAVGALNAARALGIPVPDRLTIVGFDDIAMAAWEVFRLTTVRQDLAAMSGAAIRLLLDRIDDPGRPPRRVRVPVELVPRGSHGAPARA